MITEKRPEANLKSAYRKFIEVGIILSLLIHILLFRAVPEFGMASDGKKAKDIVISVADIPPTEQIVLPQRPPRPSIPIPTEDESIPDDVTIESTELDISEIPPPPEPSLSDGYGSYEFIPYDEPPVPIGGFAKIRSNLVYPQIAVKAGIEGSVVMGVLIDEQGRVLKVEVLKAAGNNIGFEEAAAKAIKSTKWKPAKQRDVPVKVWVSVPIRFLLAKSQTS